jgi:hypothetical protein
VRANIIENLTAIGAAFPLNGRHAGQLAKARHENVLDQSGSRRGRHTNRCAVDRFKPCSGNALAARAEGSVNLTMRIYSPKSDALTGKWSPLAAKRAQ